MYFWKGKVTDYVITMILLRMAEMLAKFRIDYSDLIMIPDYNKKPQESTKNFFDSLITNFKSEGNEMKGNLQFQCVIYVKDVVRNKG